jgi:hypothetical protein
MNVDPPKGIGRALFSALSQLAQTSSHPELASARLILLGFSGTGSLVGRLAQYAPTRVLAVIPTDPGHFDPLGVDTISLSPAAAAIPQLILTGSSDAVSGTQRPYAYFRRYFDQGAPWTFVVQNKAPHCCIMNAKALIPEWLDAVVVQRATRATGWYGFIETRPSEAMDCSDLVRQDIPIIWTRRERARGPSSSAIKTRCHCPSTTSPPLTCSVRWWPSNIARKCESAFIRSQSEWSGLL